MTPAETVGRLRRARLRAVDAELTRLGASREELARLAGISGVTLYRLMNGRNRRPQRRTMERIERGLAVLAETRGGN